MISLLNESNVNFEERKRALQRKEMNDAYKKHAAYTKQKNPMLEALENLLNGKTEKEVNEENLLTLLEEEINALESDGQDDNSSVQYSSDQLQQSFYFGQNNVTQNVTSAFKQIQETKSQLASGEEDEFFTNERFNFEIPKQFLESFDRDIKDVRSFAKDLESLFLENTYNKAISSYTNQMQMAQNGFKVNQPQYSLIA